MKRSLTISLIATIAVLTVVGCDHDDQDQDQPSTMPSVDSEPAPANPNVIAIPAAVRQNLGITFVKPEYRRVADTLRVPGRFELLPTARHEIRAPFGGRVELLIKQYDRVQAGELIARISSPDWHRQQLELEEDGADVTRARAELAIVQQSLVEGQGKVKLLEERVARLQQVELLSTTVLEFSLQHVEHLRARVLEDRVTLGVVIHGDQKRLETLVRTLVIRKQVVGVPALGATPHHFHAHALLDKLGTCAGGVVLQEQCRHRNAQCAGNPRQCVRTGRCLSRFDLGQHAPTDVGAFGDLRDGQSVAQTHFANAGTQQILQ